MRISMKEIWRNLNGLPKNKELWSYVVKFEFSRLKSSSWKHSLTLVHMIFNGLILLWCPKATSGWADDFQNYSLNLNKYDNPVIL